jgi:hypothetical protein
MPAPVISLNSTDDNSENKPVVHNPCIRRRHHSPYPSFEAEDSTSLPAAFTTLPIVDDGGSGFDLPPALDDGSTGSLDDQSSPLASGSKALREEEIISSDSEFRSENSGKADDELVAIKEEINKMQDTVDGIHC